MRPGALTRRWSNVRQVMSQKSRRSEAIAETSLNATDRRRELSWRSEMCCLTSYWYTSSFVSWLCRVLALVGFSSNAFLRTNRFDRAFADLSHCRLGAVAVGRKHGTSAT
ncbi:unnamed protein product [Symbiodinium necroappetens]|uniref:Uncharacterized protein n=1 Tax=Symbiodinium necroappetens TaxID=1628268 RepID=A0A812ZW13_9DINO|nr:unnamed protein product [Symbiodinium necroappetens]